MIVAILAAVALVTFGAESYAASIDQSSIVQHGNFCGYQFDDYSSANSTIVESSRPGERVRTFKAALRLSDDATKGFAEFMVSCVDGDTSESSAPGDPTSYGAVPDARETVEDEDAGGRYFRNVAFQIKVKGENWRGTLVFIDYQFGDGQKAVIKRYIFCQDDQNASCPEINADKISLPNGETLDLVLKFLRKVRFASANCVDFPIVRKAFHEGDVQCDFDTAVSDGRIGALGSRLQA